MSDQRMREMDRAAQATQDPELALRARMARIRAGLESVPEQGRYQVLDPLHLDGLRKKVARLAKVATRKGAIPLSLWEAPQAEWIERARPDGTTALIRVREVAILGDAPTTGDWEYVALLHHVRVEGDEVATILHRAPGAVHLSDDELATYRARGPICDHCSFRRARHDTYVVRHRVTGQCAQVGRSCLETYTSQNPNAAVYAFDALREITEQLQECSELKDEPESERGVRLDMFLACALAWPNLGPQAVWHRAWALGTPEYHEPLRETFEAEVLAVRPRTLEILADARARMLPALAEEQRRQALVEAGEEPGEWPAEIARLPERWHNVSVVVAEGVVSARETMTAMVLVQWAREREAQDPRRLLAEVARAGATVEGERVSMSVETLMALLASPEVRAEVERMRQAQEPELAGDYLGPVGARGTWTLEVSDVRPFRQGGGAVVILRHASGRRAVVFARGALANTFGSLRSRAVRVSAEIKEQSWNGYRNRAETVLDRVEVAA